MTISRRSPTLRPLRGVRVLSLALNIPGPAALMRLRTLGAQCSKIEPPAGDPLAHYDKAAYATMHQGVKVSTVDLRQEKGQARLRRVLARTDVLLTSFRPSALARLGLDWKPLHKACPHLSMVAIVGASGARAEEPGHDLTYMAEHGLVAGLQLPPTAFADMGGSLMAAEAVLAAVLEQRRTGKGVRVEVALADAAAYLGLPHHWGLTLPGTLLGGAHAGYRVYACRDGRVAIAALEPHFAASVCQVVGVNDTGPRALFEPRAHEQVARFFAERTCRELDALARQHDLPLHCLPD